jgi:hypothetical protein
MTQNTKDAVPTAGEKESTLDLARDFAIAYDDGTFEFDEDSLGRFVDVLRVEIARDLYVAPTAETAEGVLTPAARDVLAERQRQVTAEGWTPEHDDEHANGDLALAAAWYAASAGGVPWSDDVPSFWPWADQWWKPTTPRRDLVKARALIIAEIERIDRAAASTGDQA